MSAQTPWRRVCLSSALCGLVACFTVVRPLSALDPRKAFSQYAVSSWQNQSGLKSSTVMAVAQSRDGFLWLATEQGLVRYDGLTMVTYDERNSPGLGDRIIRSLAADPDGSLWIGTSTGLVHYRNGRFTSYRKESKAAWDIFDICVDGQGGVWFSSNVGLFHFTNGGIRLYTTSDGLPDNDISGLMLGRDGTLWFGTSAALASFKSGQFTLYDDWPGFQNNAIYALASGANGVVWIGMRNGLVGRWKNGRITKWLDETRTHKKAIECIHEDRDGSLWIAVQKLGLMRMRGHDLEVLTKQSGLPSNDPDWIFEDRENSLWIGWADAGLSMVRDTRFTTFGQREGLSSDHVASVTRSQDGGVWVGTSDAGVDHLLGQNVKVIHKSDGLASEEVRGLLLQRDGTLWVGAETSKVTKITKGQLAVLPVSNLALVGTPAFGEDGAAQPWLALDTQGGVTVYRDRHFSSAPVPGIPRALAFAPDGSLWVASYLSGLIHYKDGIAHSYAAKDGLPSLALTSVYVDRTGTVWAGTSMSGIVRWKNGRITAYSTQQGLFDNAVADILEDDYGYLWVAGSRGIWRVSLKELNDYADGRSAAIHSEVYDYSDGLRSTESSFTGKPAITRGLDGHLWFATTGGLSTIDPGRILSNRSAPHLVIEKVLIDGRQTSLDGKELQSLPGDGNLDIAFTAASFVAPEKMQFRYRLSDVDRNWIKAGSNRGAIYRGLAPGHYHFEVQAANSDGVWNADPAAFDIRLVAHFYQTLWFKALVALWAGLAIWRIYVARVRYLLKRTEELEQVVCLRTTELTSALEATRSAKELLQEQANRDSLTGLYNRRAIFGIFDRELENCRKENEPFCVVMVDADHFKSINDNYGHLAGDLVIQTIGQRLREGLRLNEAIGRYGGEELLVLLPRCTLHSAIHRAEQLRVAIQQEPVRYNDQNIAVTCSFGIAQLGVAQLSEELMEEADRALYLAKEAGRNCVRAQQTEPACNYG